MLKMSPKQQEKFINTLYRDSKYFVNWYIENNKIDKSEYPHTKPIFVNIQDDSFSSGKYAVYLKLFERLENYDESKKGFEN